MKTRKCKKCNRPIDNRGWANHQKVCQGGSKNGGRASNSLLKLSVLHLSLKQALIAAAVLYLFHKPITYAGHLAVVATLGSKAVVEWVAGSVESVAKKVDDYDTNLWGVNTNGT